MDEHRQKIDREFDTVLAGHSRENDALSQRHIKERERQQKMAATVEARRRRHIQQQQEIEMKQFLVQQKKDYTKWKDELRKVNSMMTVLVVIEVELTVLMMTVAVAGGGLAQLVATLVRSTKLLYAGPG